MAKHPTKEEAYNLFDRYGFVELEHDIFRNEKKLYFRGMRYTVHSVVWVTSDGEFSCLTTELYSPNFYWKFNGLEDLERAIVFISELDVR